LGRAAFGEALTAAPPVSGWVGVLTGESVIARLAQAAATLAGPMRSARCEA
jgi:hypothetical protein